MKPSLVASVASPVETVWASLIDVDSLIAALPGAALARDGDTVTGSLKCKLGATQVTYRLTARAEVGETEPHSAAIAVTGKEARGTGTLAASLTVALRADGANTRVDVGGDVEATGRGEAATAQAWNEVLETLVDALLPAAAAPAAPVKSAALATAAKPAAPANPKPANPKPASATPTPAAPKPTVSAAAAKPTVSAAAAKPAVSAAAAKPAVSATPAKPAAPRSSRPPLSAVPPPAAAVSGGDAGVESSRRMIYGVVGMLFLVIVRRWRKRRK